MLFWFKLLVGFALKFSHQQKKHPGSGTGVLNKSAVAEAHSLTWPIQPDYEKKCLSGVNRAGQHPSTNWTRTTRSKSHFNYHLNTFPLQPQEASHSPETATFVWQRPELWTICNQHGDYNSGSGKTLDFHLFLFSAEHVEIVDQYFGHTFLLAGCIGVFAWPEGSFHCQLRTFAEVLFSNFGKLTFNY